VAWGHCGLAGAGPRGGSSAHQAAVLGVAAGAAFGLTAALIKGMTQAFSQGFTVLLISRQMHAVIAAGALSLFLVQPAVNAGRPSSRPPLPMPRPPLPASAAEARRERTGHQFVIGARGSRSV
jgi:hypothetical protein